MTLSRVLTSIRMVPSDIDVIVQPTCPTFASWQPDFIAARTWVIGSMRSMKLDACTCGRLIRVADTCPHCGATGQSVAAPSHRGWAVLAALPLLLASACETETPEPKDSAGQVDAPKSNDEPSSPPPKSGDRVQPRDPGEPAGEIYGSPDMMDPKPAKPVELDPEPAEPVKMDPEPAKPE